MKYLLGLTLGIVLGSVSGCQKEPAAPSAPEIFGNWEWVSSRGGITGREVHTPANTGLARTMSFKRDSMFVQCENGQCTVPTKFTSRLERSQFTGEPTLILTIRRRFYLAPPDTGFHVLLSRYSIRSAADTLRITQEKPDGFEEVYQRK